MGGPKAALLFGGDANPFAEPLNDRYLRTPAIQSGTKRLILTTSDRPRVASGR
jgi:hypothetical protein